MFIHGKPFLKECHESRRPCKGSFMTLPNMTLFIPTSWSQPVTWARGAAAGRRPACVGAGTLPSFHPGLGRLNHHRRHHRDFRVPSRTQRPLWSCASPISVHWKGGGTGMRHCFMLESIGRQPESIFKTCLLWLGLPVVKNTPVY